MPKFNFPETGRWRTAAVGREGEYARHPALLGTTGVKCGHSNTPFAERGRYGTVGATAN